MNKYWDIKDILMTSEDMECVTEIDLVNVEFLDKSLNIQNNDENSSNIVIKDQSKLKLPLWISIPLRKKGWLTITHPKYLNKKFYNVLQADCVIADLKSKSRYFYEIMLTLISLELLTFLNDNETERLEKQTWKENWQKCLITTLAKRHLFLQQNSFNVMFENQKILKSACNSEKEFYDKNVFNNQKMRYYIENYMKNNNTLENEHENKLTAGKRKKTK